MFFLHCSSERLSRSIFNFDLILDLKTRASTSMVFKHFNARYIDSKYYYSLSEFYASCQLSLRFSFSVSLRVNIRPGIARSRPYVCSLSNAPSSRVASEIGNKRKPNSVISDSAGRRTARFDTVPDRRRRESGSWKSRGANGQTDFSVETSFPAAIAIILYIRELYLSNNL